MTNTSFIIAGPTASGKSDLAHQLAKKLGGVIINCDSVQIYRGIESVSASPFADGVVHDDIDGVPYRLFSVLDLSTQISVADYLSMARREYNWAINAGRPAIFVGGTGFYIDAIIRGISPIPDVGPYERSRARDMVASDICAARAMLGENAPSDPQRVSRALEVLFATGKPIAYWQDMPRSGAITPTPYRVLIDPAPDVLRERIAARVPNMVTAGALDHARAVCHIPDARRRAIGMDELCRYLDGDIDWDKALSNWITRTNQYAKRQRTWFRTQFVPDIKIASAEPNAIEKILAA